MARPRINIDKDTFEKLCALQCTEEEIAGFFNCSVDTVERWCDREFGVHFADIYKIKRQSGLISLRRAQFKLAEKNPAVAIWLGKQYLNQSERVVVASRNEEADPLSAAFALFEKEGVTSDGE